MLIKDQNSSIPEKLEIEKVLKECLFRIHSLGAEIRAMNFTIHCRLRPSQYDNLSKARKLLYDNTELEAPIANTVTFIVRSE